MKKLSKRQRFRTIKTNSRAAKKPLDYQFDFHAANPMFDIGKHCFSIFASQKPSSRRESVFSKNDNFLHEKEDIDHWRKKSGFVQFSRRETTFRVAKIRLAGFLNFGPFSPNWCPSRF